MSDLHALPAEDSYSLHRNATQAQRHTWTRTEQQVKDINLMRDQLAARASTPADFAVLKRLDEALAKHRALCTEQANLRIQTVQLRIRNERLQDRLSQAYALLDEVQLAGSKSS